MFDAAREGNTELLLAAVDAGLPPNLTNDKGNTLLMLAAYAGHVPLVRGLLERGADPNRLNDGAGAIAGRCSSARTRSCARSYLLARTHAQAPQCYCECAHVRPSGPTRGAGGAGGEGADAPPPV
ncbi:hypothetical protein BC834DRAFT_886069, partial [Gloeopeniophorella convolvens]